MTIDQALEVGPLADEEVRAFGDLIHRALFWPPLDEVDWTLELGRENIRVLRRQGRVLAGLTALETSTYWVDFGPLFMPALLIMMTIKFFMVVLLFMHLKFDNRLFGVLFYAGLFLAVFVYIAALATFRFFGS